VRAHRAVKKTGRHSVDTIYRCYFLAAPGRVTAVEELTCANDRSAMATALRLFGHGLHGGEMEVRRHADNRLIGVIGSMDPSPRACIEHPDPPPESQS